MRMSTEARVLEVLKAGLLIGAKDVADAYERYMMHSDVFFLIEPEEEFKKEIKDLVSAILPYQQYAVKDALVNFGLDPDQLLEEYEAELSAANERAKEALGNTEDFTDSNSFGL